LGYIPLFLFARSEHALQSLQQIRSLIPERFVEEEFDLQVDQKGLETSVQQLASHPKQSDIASACYLGDTTQYLLRWTFSGESIRICDTYLEFINSPYWKYPGAMMRLESLEYGSDQEDRK
jgi:hypothetical protein